jgi:hypothetical protein
MIGSTVQSIFESSDPKFLPICRFQRTPCSFKESAGRALTGTVPVLEQAGAIKVGDQIFW